MDDLKKQSANNATSEKLIRDMNEDKLNSPNTKLFLLIGAGIIIAGVLTGMVLSKNKTGSSSSSSSGSSSLIGGKKIFGSSDTSTFKDMAEGKMEKGGIDGEGTHKLIRPGGDSQNVYLTSSVLDLEQFVGKKVRVWGQTHAAKKAGWLMDVGRVEVLE